MLDALFSLWPVWLFFAVVGVLTWALERRARRREFRRVREWREIRQRVRSGVWPAHGSGSRRDVA